MKQTKEISGIKEKQKQKQKKNKKSNITFNHILMILMSLLLITIVIFGIKQFFFIKQTTSTINVHNIKNDLEKTLQFCEEPLNKGNKKILKINTKGDFNGIFLIGSDIQTAPNNQINNLLKTIYESGKKGVIFKADYFNQGGNIVLKNFEIIESFNVEYNFNDVHRFLDGINELKQGKDNVLEIDIIC